jgi:HK97 family phage major capsid protein
MDTAVTALSLFKSFTAKALARGIGRHLLTGDGSSKPLGLVTTLENTISGVTAAGSAVNDGGANTGTNSLGTPDFAAAYESLDSAYLASPCCGWVMNNNTLGSLYKQLDKYGRPIIDFTTGAPTIMGIPVKVSPSMDDIGASKVPVILGDLSYWATRIVVPGEDGGGIKSYTEAPGLAENGLVGFRSFVRADGVLLWNAGPCPFTYIRNHS